MEKYIIYLIERDKEYELGILDKTGLAVFLEHPHFKKFTNKYCNYLINTVGYRSWDFHGESWFSFRYIREAKKKTIQQLFGLDTIEGVMKKLRDLEDCKIIYCYYV